MNATVASANKMLRKASVRQSMKSAMRKKLQVEESQRRDMRLAVLDEQDRARPKEKIGPEVLKSRQSLGDLFPPPVDTESPLEGEEWMHDPKVQELLKIRDDARQRVAELRKEAQSKVMRLRLEQQFNPHQMSFVDKMAYFTTAKVGIHEDIEKRVTEEDRVRRASQDHQLLNLENDDDDDNDDNDDNDDDD